MKLVVKVRRNTARLRIVELPETRFLKETGFLIFAYPSSIEVRRALGSGFPVGRRKTDNMRAVSRIKNYQLFTIS